ncbi:MAG: 3-methyl-2-oxobutanoate hydroxymethyltransferase [archaeon]|nr:3-methyl-2-oxobutanoate hydroxymethyltransferase [archaeon]
MIAHVRNMHAKKIVMVTAYDYPSAKIANAADVDMILVGDSAANVIHGMKSTKEIGMHEMLLHVAAVSRSKPKALVVADMPYGSDTTPLKALGNARLFIKAGAGAVKIEGAKPQAIEAIAKAGILAMGHLGYLPQTAEKPAVERDEKALLRDAKALEAAGASWIVLELVPEKIAKKISQTISIPTIGIGAGRYCSGQVLVFHDILGLGDPDFNPKFLKKYASLGEGAVKAIKKYAKEVREGKFPEKKNVY